jgi:ribosomal protein L37AE/L43A
MTTPVEAHLGAQVFKRIRDGATYLFKLGKRIATLEARVTALEEAQNRQLPDACPFCGERAMRKTEDGRILGSPPNQWKQDTWTCAACNKTEVRPVRF